MLAAAVAVGEDLDVSLSDLIGAFVAGYETMARVGLPIGAKMFKVYHVHPTGFLGYLGAAAAAGKLLGLSEGQLAMALGIAGTQAGGLLESVGTMSEGYCASHPSSGGLTAARLAAAGFEGTPAILNGDAGIFAAFGAPRDLDLVNDDGFEIRRNEFKMYPSCGFTHPMLDALLELRREIPDGMPWDQVTVKVRLWTPAADLVDRPGPRTGPEARFSAQFCAAVALIDGVAGPDQFADDRTRDPEVLALMKAVEIVRDDQLNRHQSNVVIEAAGDAWEHFATNEGREVDEGRLVDKFVGLTAPLYGQGDASRMAKTILTSTACKVSTLLTPARRSSR